MQFNTDLNRENFLSNLIQIYSLFQREKKRYFERISQHIYISSVPKKKRKEKEKSSERVIIDSVLASSESSFILSSFFAPLCPFPLRHLSRSERVFRKASTSGVGCINYFRDRLNCTDRCRFQLYCFIYIYLCSLWTPSSPPCNFLFHLPPNFFL